MNVDAAIAILLILMNLVIFLCLRNLLTSMTRQLLFESRDALFDLATEGLIDFSSPEYRAIRGSFEKLIRYAHDLSLTQFLIFRWHMKRNEYVPQESELALAVRNIRNEETRRRVHELVSKAHNAMFWLMIGKSPWTFYLFLFSLGLRKFARTMPIWIKRVATRAAETIQIEAEAAPINTGWKLAA
jgi:hypothetical protein